VWPATRLSTIVVKPGMTSALAHVTGLNEARGRPRTRPRGRSGSPAVEGPLGRSTRSSGSTSAQSSYRFDRSLRTGSSTRLRPRHSG
jgi:hypothetical protein